MNLLQNRKLIKFMIDYQRDNNMKIVTWKTTDKSLVLVFDKTRKIFKLEHII